MAKKTHIGFFSFLGITLTILLAIVLSYIYYIGFSFQPQSGVVERFIIGLESLGNRIQGKIDTFSHTFDLTTELKVNHNQTQSQGSFHVSDGKIYADRFGKQLISAGSIDIGLQNYNGNHTAQIQNLELISDTYTHYLNAKGIQDIVSFIHKVSAPQLSDTWGKVLEGMDSSEYVVFDNGAYFKENENRGEKLLPTEIMFQLLGSGVFFDKDFQLQWKKFLYRDTWIDMVFDPIESQNIHQSYVLNANICKIFHNSLSDCYKSFDDMNVFLQLFSQISSEGDREKGNFFFTLSQGDRLTFQLEYKDHILHTWSMDLHIAEFQSQAKFEGNKFGITQSVIDIQKEIGSLQVIGKIFNGTGKLFITSQNGDSQSEGFIEFQDYTIFDMDIKSDTHDVQGVVIADGNSESGVIEYNFDDNKKVHFTYSGNAYNFDFFTELLQMNLFSSQGKFIGAYARKNKQQEVIQEFKYIYHQGEILGHYRDNSQEITLDAQLLDHQDLYFNISKKTTDEEIKIRMGAQKGENTLLSHIEAKVNEDPIILFKATGEIGKKQMDIGIDFSFPQEEIDIQTKTKIHYEAANIVYQTPEGEQQSILPLENKIVIPNIFVGESLGDSRFLFPVLSFGVIRYISDTLSIQQKERNQTNMYKQDDVYMLREKISQYKQKNDIFSLVIPVHHAEEFKNISLRIGGNKIQSGALYRFGAIDYGRLFGEEPYELYNNGQEYSLAVVQKNDIQEFQIYTHLSKNKYVDRVLLLGDYMPREFIRYDFEIVDGGENGDTEQVHLKILTQHDLQIGDTTNVGKIIDIQGDQVVLEDMLNDDLSKIYLLGNDSPSLFFKEGKNILNNQEIKRKEK